MGVDAGDFDNDGDEDLFMTEQTGEGANLYVNDGTGTFEDRSLRSGLGAATLPYTGFGTAWFDVDNDGRLDILTVNGAVQTIQALAQAHDRFRCISGSSCSAISATARSRTSRREAAPCSSSRK